MGWSEAKKVRKRASEFVTQAKKDGYREFYCHTEGHFYEMTYRGFVLHAVEFYLDLCAPISTTPKERILMAQDEWIFECPSCHLHYNLSPAGHIIEPDMMNLRVCTTKDKRLGPFSHKELLERRNAKHKRRIDRIATISLDEPEKPADDNEDGIK